MPDTALATNRTLKTIARRVLEQDVDATIGELFLRHQTHIKLLEDALVLAVPGTRTYLQYVTKLEELQNSFVELCQSLGVLPKNLGNSTVTKYQFSSSIGIMPEDARDRRTQ